MWWQVIRKEQVSVSGAHTPMHVHTHTHRESHTHITTDRYAQSHRHTTTQKYMHSHIQNVSKFPMVRFPPVLQSSAAQQQQQNSSRKGTVGKVVWWGFQACTSAREPELASKAQRWWQEPWAPACISLERKGATFSQTTSDRCPEQRRRFQGKRTQRDGLRLTLKAKVQAEAMDALRRAGIH